MVLTLRCNCSSRCILCEEFLDLGGDGTSLSLSGKTQREIAEEFHITINTVKKHINNANHQLRRRLKDALLAVCHLLARPA